MAGRHRALAATTGFVVRCAVAVATAASLSVPATAQHPASGAGYEAAVDALMAEYNRADAPGAVIGVVHAGELILAKAYGMASLEQGTRLTTESILDVGSVAKELTAFAVVLLAQRGELGLDADIRTYLPDVPDFGSTITVRHLVHHLSGLREIYDANGLAGYQSGDGIGQEDALQLTRGMRELNFEPGTEYLYSNTGYMLLADIVARVSATSFADFMSENVFRPLGMERTTVMARRGQVIPGAAESYGPAPDGGFLRIFDNSGIQGAGGVYTTVSDLAKWITNLRTGAVGGQEAIEQMKQHGVLAGGDTIPYAFGVTVTRYRGLERIAHSGSSAGYRASVAYFPELDVGFIRQSNRSDFPARLDREIVELFLGDRLAPMAAAEPGAGDEDGPASGDPAAWTPSEDELRSFEGRYFSPEIETLYTLAVEEGALVARHRRHDDAELTPREVDTFASSAFTARFERDVAGRVTGMRVTTGRVRNLLFERVGG